MALDFIGFIAANTPQLSAAQKQALLEDFCAQYGYRATLEDGSPNPVSKADFANAAITRFIRESVNARRATEARLAAVYEELDL